MASPEVSKGEKSPQNERIKIDSREQLRSELGITSPMNMPENFQAFEVTKKDLETFRKSLTNLPTQEQLEKIKVFIAEKSKVVVDAQDKADDLKKALAVSGVSAIVWTAFAGVSKEITQLKGKEWLGFLDWIASLWDKIATMWDSFTDGINNWIVWKFPALAKMFGIEATVPKIPDNGVDSGIAWKILEWWEKRQENSAEKWAKWVFEQILKTKKEWKTPDTKLQEFFTHQKLLSLSLKQVREYISSPSWIAVTLGFDAKEQDNVLNTLKLYDSEVCKNLLKQSQEVNENEPLSLSFARTSRYFMFLENMRNKKTNLSLKDVSFGEDSFPSTGDVKDFIGEKKETLIALHERFWGFTPNVLKSIHTHFSTESYKTCDYTSHKNEFNEKEWDFMNTTLPEYAKTLPTMLMGWGYGDQDMKKEIAEHIQNPWLKQSDLIDFFVLSGGNSDFEKMSDFEKAQVTMRIILMIRWEGTFSEKVKGYKFISKIGLNIINDKESSLKIPSSVKNIIKDGMWFALEAMLWWATEVAAIIAALALEHPWITSAAGSAFMGILVLAIKLSPIGRIASTIHILLSLLAVGGVVSAYYSFNKDNGDITETKSGKVVDNAKKMAMEIWATK